MNHYHNRLQGGHFVPGQYVSWDNMSPSCTGTICLLGQYVPFLNSKIMSNRGTFCPGDVLSRDNICPGTICPGTKCPLTLSFRLSLQTSPSPTIHIALLLLCDCSRLNPIEIFLKILSFDPSRIDLSISHLGKGKDPRDMGATFLPDGPQ